MSKPKHLSDGNVPPFRERDRGRLPSFGGVGGGRKYEHLFFDLDNTLWDFDTNARLAMQETVSQLKIESQLPDFDSFYHFYEQVNTSLWEAYRKQEIRKPELIKKRFEDTLARFQIEGIDPVEMNDLYLKIMPRQKQLVTGALETLSYLKSKRYHLHIITNGFKEVQHAKINTCGLAPYFEGIFISEEIQAPKPDKRIFKHALMNCNAKKSKSTMIGDSFETDILGAKQFGMDSIHLQKNTNSTDTPPVFTNLSQNTDNITPTTPSYKTSVIENLTQLLDIF